MLISFQEKISQINRLVDQGQKEKAIELIFNEIVDYAKAKQFDKADKLRRKLIEVDSMALNKIIESAEIIDAEKFAAIDPTHKKTWRMLYDEFTVEEANAFYFALKNIKIKSDKTIIKQSKLNNKLFFVDSGSLRVVYFKDGRELLLKTVTSGQVSGVDTFFSISVATASTVSMEESYLKYLEIDDFEDIAKEHAGFDKKLERLCKNQITSEISDIIRKKGIERRISHRYKASGKVAIYRLDANKQPEEIPLSAMLEDLSEAGLSFYVRSPDKERARSYLGNIVILKILFKKTEKKIIKKGIVLSVFDKGFNEYSMGVRFLQPTASSEIEEFVRTN